MESQLIIKLDASLKEEALNYAKSRKQNLSDIVSAMLKKMIYAPSQKHVQISDEVKDLIGILPSMDDCEWKEERMEYLSNKYK